MLISVLDLNFLCLDAHACVHARVTHSPIARREEKRFVCKGARWLPHAKFDARARGKKENEEIKSEVGRFYMIERRRRRRGRRARDTCKAPREFRNTKIGEFYNPCTGIISGLYHTRGRTTEETETAVGSKRRKRRRRTARTTKERKKKADIERRGISRTSDRS